MPGLSDKKKESRKKKIFDTALALFEELGYEKTTMADIAQRAGLAVGTLYNYYPSKLVLLFSIIMAGAGQYIDQLDEVITKASDLQTSISAFFRIYLKSFSTYGKKVWRELFGEVMFKKNELLESIDIIDKPFIDKLRDLLCVFQGRGLLDDSADIESAVSALYALLAYNIMRYVSEDGISEEDLKKSLLSQAGLIIGAVIQ